MHVKSQEISNEALYEGIAGIAIVTLLGVIILKVTKKNKIK